MNKYELLYIISSSATEEQREALIEKVKGMIEAKGGEVLTTDKWGIRKFAYPINFKNEGFYVLLEVNMVPETVKDVNNLMCITDNIVRQIFIKKQIKK